MGNAEENYTEMKQHTCSSSVLKELLKTLIPATNHPRLERLADRSCCRSHVSWRFQEFASSTSRPHFVVVFFLAIPPPRYQCQNNQPRALNGWRVCHVLSCVTWCFDFCVCSFLGTPISTKLYLHNYHFNSIFWNCRDKMPWLEWFFIITKKPITQFHPIPTNTHTHVHSRI